MRKFFENELGFITLVPVLIVAAFLLLSLTASSLKKNLSRSASKNSVLSESSGGGDSSSGSSGGGDHGGTSGGTSGSGSSGGGGESLQTTTQFGTPAPAGSGEINRLNLQQTLRVREPEATEKPELETPEPSASPEVELENEFEAEVKDGTGEAKIKLHKGDAFQFEQEGLHVQIQGQTPLSVNPTTHELTVTTPAGAKVVATLPDQAFQNLVNGGVLSAQSGINLTSDSNGNLVYEVNGVKYERLFGLFTIAIDKTGQVSAQDGQIVGVTQSSFSKLLDSLSF